MNVGHVFTFLKMIGTSISLRTALNFTYPSISVCSWDDPAVLVEGELFESRDAYRDFTKANVSTQYESGRIPNLADTLNYILTKDANGTRHVLYPAEARIHAWILKKMASNVTSLGSTR